MKQEENQAPVEQPEVSSGNEGKKDSVAYESFQKALHEKKQAQVKAQEMAAELEKLREQKMESEGKKDELLETYRNKVKALESEFSNTKKQYAWSTLTGEIKREAIKQGCEDPDKLIKLMSDDDLKSIEIGENFSIDNESLKNVIEKSKTDNYFLFKTSNKAIANGNPTKKIDESSKLKDLSKLSDEELTEMYKKYYK